jgi:hypothetical protein
VIVIVLGAVALACKLVRRSHGRSAASPKRSRRSISVAVLAALAVSFSSSGCEKDRPQLSGDQRPTSLAAELSGMSSADDEFVFVEEYIGRCMADIGLVYTPQRPPPGEPDSRKRRQRIGFGFGSREPTKPIELRNVHLVDFGDRERRWKVEFTRCLEDGLQAAAAEVEDALRALPRDVAEEIQSLAGFTHPVMRDAIAKWSQCLAEKGWNFQHPMEVLVYLREDAESGGAELSDEDVARREAEERAIAVADWDCRRQSGADAALTHLLEELQARAVVDGAPRAGLRN